MLMGEFPHNMDAKGRVTIPVRFREDLGDRFYVTKGLDGCLFVFSPVRWERLVEKMASLPIANAHSLQRFFFSSAADCAPDSQGRVLIPQNLREYAGLQKEVTVIGVSGRVEIWDKQRWKEYNGELTSESIAEAMEDLGF